MPDVHLEVISFFLRGHHGQGKGGGDADGRGHWSFRWHGQASWPDEYTQHKPIPTLIVPDMPSKCANEAVQGSRANNWSSGKWGADHLCTRRDVFRASMLVEALLMLVESGAGSVKTNQANALLVTH